MPMPMSMSKSASSSPSPSQPQPPSPDNIINVRHSSHYANEREAIGGSLHLGDAGGNLTECLSTNDDADVGYRSDELQNAFRRSSSLKAPKEYASASASASTSTSMTTNANDDVSAAQKKIVRFADVLGLDLANVRVFMQELPSVPKRAYQDLQVQMKRDVDVEVDAEAEMCKSLLLPTFKMPCESINFFDRIRDQCVCLETVGVLESPVRHISGQIVVKNLDFRKSVYVRYTLDEWKTCGQVRATYVEEAEAEVGVRVRVRVSDRHQPYDKFAFVIYVYDTIAAVGRRVEFAIEYHCQGRVYWDNNDGNNYVLQCSPYSPSMPSCFHYSPSPTSAENFHSFSLY